MAGVGASSAGMFWGAAEVCWVGGKDVDVDVRGGKVWGADASGRVSISTVETRD